MAAMRNLASEFLNDKNGTVGLPSNWPANSWLNFGIRISYRRIRKEGKGKMENRMGVPESEKSTCGLHRISACGDHSQLERPTEVLTAEHRTIERVLDVLEKLSTRPVEDSLDSWRKALDFFSHFADQCHHFKEEQVLFPAMEAHGIPSDGGPVGVMLMEHVEGRSYVRAMAAAIPLVERKNHAAKEILIDKAKAYLRLLREHIHKEDEVLFRIADDVIPAEEQKKLFRSFEEHEANQMGAGAHEKYLKLVEELERSVP
jgi:hemerythrin-like domain-containing protein